MTQSVSRRAFLASSALTGLLSDWSADKLQALAATSSLTQDVSASAPRQGSKPLAIASNNGIRAIERAIKLMKAGGIPLDAVIDGVTLVEDDPEDSSVGYGGLPNAEGEVELDACVMNGPTGAAGAVAALKHVRNPAKVARLVMERTNRVLLVGEGALRFALAHGFQKENLLTEKSRLAWLKWKEELSDMDDWVAPPKKEGPPHSALDHGTINCLAIDAKGDIAGVTTTSGLPFKLPGRVGDSPIIGAGLYVDNAVGAAGATGNGEANIRVVGSHTVVELMRLGRSPEQACLDALQRVVDLYKGRPPDLKFYALNSKGQFGSAAIYKGGKYCVHDGNLAYLRDCAWLLEKKPA